MVLRRRSAAPLPQLEMVPLAERLRAMAIFRVLLAGLVIGVSVGLPDVLHGDPRTLTTATVGYAAISLAGYLLWKAWPGRGLFLFSGLLLSDGAYLAWATFFCGGVGGPVSYLAIAYVVTVALVASYRTALKLVLWQSLLFMSAFYIQDTGVFPALGIDQPTQAASHYREVAVFVAGLWLVAVVTAMYSALNERELRRRRFDLTALTNMASELERDLRPSAIAQVFLDSTVEAFGFVRGAVLANSGYERLATLASSGLSGEPAAMPPTGVIESVWKTREALLIKRLSDQDSGLAELLPAARNLVVVPMIAESHAIGALVVEHPKPRIDQRALTILAQFAAHASLALRNAWLLEEMRTMADRDPLTGIANRRSFDVRLELELKRAQRTNDPLSLLLIDLDHFKQVNDIHGHQAGDEALRSVAAELAASARGMDLAARYGGEEFAIILPSCPSEEAVDVAERMRGAISKLDGVPMSLTGSVGVASWPYNALDVDALVAAADEALYTAKRTGRDRVVSSTLTLDELLVGPG